jgi:aspartyl-tRNA(Asn)/glutamyl-tRNA(Gln) amidotransferase subunit A
LRRLKAGEPFTGMDYAHSLRVFVQWKHQFRQVFQEVDLILFPTTPIVAPKFANAEDLQKATHQISRNNVAIGYAGLPCLNVPVGFDSDGLPVGMLLVGEWFNEPLVFRAGVAYQSLTEFHKMRPKLAA